jgi:hypothetical protein
MTTKFLAFSDLSKRHVGVSDGISASYSEAACVCLDRHHTSPTAFKVRDNTKNDVAGVKWIKANRRIANAWANKDDATEAGAYGLALAAIEVMRGLVAIRRAETKTGADYYLGPIGSSLDDLEVSYRLEVSGTDEGGASIIDARLKQKIDQALNGNSNLPAIASVVGFAALKIAFADVEQ